MLSSRLFHHGLLGLALSLGSSLLAVPAQADKPAKGEAKEEAEVSDEAREEASERFRRGVKLYKDNDYVAALVEFKRAYELAPNYRVLYNLGQTSRELKDYASALTAYRQYLAEGGDEVKGARKKEVEGAIEDLVARVGTLSITTDVEGAEIQIDDVVVGVTPLDEPVVVNVGQRRIVATLSGHAPARRVVEVAGKAALDIELELPDLTRPEPTGPTPSSQPKPGIGEEESHVPVAGIVAISITGACGIAAGIVGGLALGARGDLDTALETFPGDATSIEDAQSRVSTLALVTDVMLGVTAAGAITSLVLFIVNPGSGSSDETSEEDAGVEVSVLPSPTGLWLQGTF